jgi:hypothetical protein
MRYSSEEDTILKWTQMMKELLFAVPPDYSFCETHMASSSVGYYDPEDEPNQFTCGCCKEPVLKRPFKLNCSINKFRHYGPGYPFYFLFFRYILMNLLLIYVCIICPELIVYLVYKMQVSSEGQPFFNDIFQDYYKFKNKEADVYFWFIFFFFVIQMLYTIYFLFQMKNTLYKSKVLCFDGSSRTLLLEDLPAVWDEQHIREACVEKIPVVGGEIFLNDSGQKEIEQIIWIPDLENYSFIKKEFMRLNKQKIKLLLKSPLFENMRVQQKCCKLTEVDALFQQDSYVRIGSIPLREKLLSINEKIHRSHVDMKMIKQQYNANPETNSVQSALVRFQSVQDLEDHHFLLKNSSEHMGFMVSPAPAAAVIIWERKNMKFWEKALVFLAVYNGILIFGALNTWAEIKLEGLASALKRPFFGSFLLMGTIIVFSCITNIFLGLITRTEHFSRYSVYKKEVFYRHLAGTVVNMIMSPMLAYIIITIKKDGQLLNQMNICYTVFLGFTLFWFSFLSHFRDIFTISSFTKIYYVVKIKYGSINDILTPQTNVNQFYEKLDFNLTERYSFLLLAFSNNLLVQIMPGGVLLATIGAILLGISYWIDKFFFIKLSRKPVYIDQSLCKCSFICYLLTQTCIIWVKTFSILSVSDHSYSYLYSTAAPLLVTASVTGIMVILIWFGNKILSEARIKEDAFGINNSSPILQKSSERLLFSYEDFNPVWEYTHEKKANTSFSLPKVDFDFEPENDRISVISKQTIEQFNEYINAQNYDKSQLNMEERFDSGNERKNKSNQDIWCLD